MKKILCALIGMLLLVSYGCSGDDVKEPEENTTEVITTPNEPTPAANETPVEESKDTVQPTKKRAPIEGC